MIDSGELKGKQESQGKKKILQMLWIQTKREIQCSKLLGDEMLLFIYLRSETYINICY